MNGMEMRLFERPLAIHPSYARSIAAFSARSAGVQNIVFSEGDTRIEMKDGPSQEAFFEFMFSARDDLEYDLVDGIAVIPVRGCLSPRSYWGASYESLAATLRSALANNDVKAILFDIDSPGGDVSGLFDFADEIFEARGEKPIWAMASELAASAAYAIGSAADQLFLPRTGEVGSIGVLMLHFDETAALDKYGITITPIFSGAHKVDGAWYQKLSEPAKARFQTEVGDTYELFVNTVARNRDLSVEAVRGTEALTYRGQHAVDAGLADEVMAKRDVLEALQALLAEVTGETQDADPAANPKERSKAMKTTKPAAGRRPAARTATPKPKAAVAADPVNEEDAAEGEDGEEEPEAAPANEEDAAEGDDAEGDGEEDAPAPKDAKGERKRIASILGCEEAKGKTKLANHIALSTSLSLKDAKSLLKNGGAEATTGALSTLMKGRDPTIGGAAPADPDTRLAAASARFSSRHGIKR